MIVPKSRERALTASLYGVGVGYDFQAGGAVLGVEAEASGFLGRRMRRRFGRRRRRACAAASAATSMSAAASAPSCGGNTLLYAKAGYTNARVRFDYDDGTAGGADNFSLSENFDGIRAGAGAQFGLGAECLSEDRISLFELRAGPRPAPGGRRRRLPLLRERQRIEGAGAVTLRPFFLAQSTGGLRGGRYNPSSDLEDCG